MKLWVEVEEFDDKSLQIAREDTWNKEDLAEVRYTKRYKEFADVKDLRAWTKEKALNIQKNEYIYGKNYEFARELLAELEAGR